MSARDDIRQRRRRRKRQEAWSKTPRIYRQPGRNRHPKGYVPMFKSRLPTVEEMLAYQMAALERLLERKPLA